MGHTPHAEMAGLPLSPRESEALRRYARHPLYKAVANEMGISVTTVKFHLWAVRTKLDVASNIDAFRERGWLRVPRVRD